jgi:hypothetical protein
VRGETADSCESQRWVSVEISTVTDLVRFKPLNGRSWTAYDAGRITPVLAVLANKTQPKRG